MNLMLFLMGIFICHSKNASCWKNIQFIKLLYWNSFQVDGNIQIKLSRIVPDVKRPFYLCIVYHAEDRNYWDEAVHSKNVQNGKVMSLCDNSFIEFIVSAVKSKGLILSYSSPSSIQTEKSSVNCEISTLSAW